MCTRSADTTVNKLIAIFAMISDECCVVGALTERVHALHFEKKISLSLEFVENLPGSKEQSDKK